MGYRRGLPCGVFNVAVVNSTIQKVLILYLEDTNLNHFIQVGSFKDNLPLRPKINKFCLL